MLGKIGGMEIKEEDNKQKRSMKSEVTEIFIILLF